MCLEQLSAIAEFSRLGPLFKSSEKPVELTESETEYVVRCIKHMYLKHIVFQVLQVGFYIFCVPKLNSEIYLP